MRAATSRKHKAMWMAFYSAFLTAALAMAPAGEDAAIEQLRLTGKAFSKVARQTMPAVVFIQIERVRTARGGYSYNDPRGFYGDEMLRRFFGFPPSQPEQRYREVAGQGSGFIVTKDGYILTNNHVVGAADRIVVKLSDGREFDARLIGSDPRSEVAVIKIDTEGDLPFVELGDSADLEIGEWAIAVGNPFGLAESLTVGVISAKGRSIGIAEYEDFIQTDAAINPGNSGGPLLNIDGKVIGVNTAIYSRSGGYMGIGFAIPINIARSVMEQFVSNDGKLRRGFLGVTFNRREVDEDMAELLKLPRPGGVLVAGVNTDSPAAEAGVREGDVIVEVNAEAVFSNAALRNKIAFLPPGTPVRLTVYRDGKPRKIDVTLGIYPEDRESAVIAGELLGKLDLQVQDMTREMALQLGYGAEGGVRVTQVGSNGPADRAGIHDKCLILGVNQIRVRTVEEFYEALAAAAKHDRMLLKVEDQNYVWYVPIRLHD